jgi:hypothetical protein
MLQAGQPVKWSLIPGWTDTFLFTTTSNLRTAQRPIQYVLRDFYIEVMQLRYETNHSPLTTAEVNKALGPHLHSTLYLYSMVFNELSTGTILTC